jgi:O-antigen ligase/tetratricopeptide (TPR) repeat protein
MDINKILRNTILVGIFLIPFIPLYVANGMFFPFITGKNFTFRIIVEIILALWAILALRDRSYMPGKSMVISSVGAFLAVMTVADIFGANFYRSFWSNYERMEGLVALLHMCGYFLVAGSVLNTGKLWDKYLKTILGAGVLISLFVFGQLAGMFNINQGAWRVDATFGNSTYLAVHMLFLMFIAMYYHFRTKEVVTRTSRFLYIVLTGLYLFVLYRTATRGALIGLVIGTIATGLLLVYHESGRTKKIATRVLTGIFLALLLFIPARNLNFIKNSQTLNRFTQINFESITHEPRLMVWGSALKGFMENPILGWGQDNFNLVFNKYYNPGMYSQEPWFDRAHDVFFDWLTAGGILGLLSYLGIFFAAIYTIWRRSDRLVLTVTDKAILTGMLIAYFIQNIFVFDNLMSYTLFFTLLAYLHYGSRVMPVVTHKARVSNSEDKLFLQVSSSIILIGLILSMYFVNVKPILASKAIIGALSSPDLKQGLDKFKQVFAYKTFGSVEAREQLTQRAVAVRGSDAPNDVKLEYFNLAKDEMLKQIESSPDDARYRVFLSTLFTNYGLQDDALAQAQKAVELSPKKQTLLFGLASVYINRGQFDKAYEIAKYAHEVEPNFNEAQNIYAAISIYAKKDNEPAIQEILNKNFGSDTPLDDRFISAYAAVARYDKVIEIWKKKIEKDPNNPQFHISLAASYLGNKQRSLAISELRVAIKMNPAFKEQGEHFISEIQAGRNP